MMAACRATCGALPDDDKQAEKPYGRVQLPSICPRGNLHEARADPDRRCLARHCCCLLRPSRRPIAGLLPRTRDRRGAHALQARHRLRDCRRGAAGGRRMDGTAVRGEGVITVGSSGGVVRMSHRVMNLAHLLTQNARRHGDRIGFIWAEKSWTWREIDAHVSALSAALAARGIVKGDRILVHAKNCDEMFWSMFAAFRLGAVWVPTNFRLMPDEVAYLATASGARAFLCHGDFSDHVAAVQAASPALAFIWRIGEGGFGEKSVSEAIAAHAGARVGNTAVAYEDPCWFFFTSGTTGRSKAAVLTHGQMAFVVTNHLADLMPGTTENDASLAVAPLSHGAGIHQPRHSARAVITILRPPDRFDRNDTYRPIETHRVSNIFTVPTILKMMVEHPAIGRYDHSSLRYVIYAGAPMYREDQKAALQKLARVLVQYFGLGEVTGSITVLPPALHDPEDGPHARIRTCGIERTGMQVSIHADPWHDLN